MYVVTHEGSKQVHPLNLLCLQDIFAGMGSWDSKKIYENNGHVFIIGTESFQHINIPMYNFCSIPAVGNIEIIYNQSTM